MLIHAIHAALEDAEEAFNRVPVCIAAHIFLRAVIDALVIREVLTDLRVLSRFVSHQSGGIGYVFGKLLPKRHARNVIDVERADMSGTLYKGERRFLVTAAAADLGSRFAADKGFVASTMPLPLPRIPPGEFIASRMRWDMNQAVLYCTSSVRCNWWLLHPFLLEQIR